MKDNDKKSPEVKEGEELHRRMAKDFYQETAERIVGNAKAERSSSMTEVFNLCYGTDSLSYEALKKRMDSEDTRRLHACWKILNKDCVSHATEEQVIDRLYDVVPHDPSRSEKDPPGHYSFYNASQVTLIAMNTIKSVLDAAVEAEQIKPEVGAALSLLFMGRLKIEMAYEFPVAFFTDRDKEKNDDHK